MIFSRSIPCPLGLFLLLLTAGCQHDARPKHRPVRPANELESLTTRPVADAATLDAVIAKLTTEVQALQDEQTMIAARIDRLARPANQTVDAGAGREQTLADLRAVGIRLSQLENELFGVQQMATRLYPFGRPDLRTCAGALEKLRQEWNARWLDMAGRPWTAGHEPGKAESGAQ